MSDSASFFDNFRRGLNNGRRPAAEALVELGSQEFSELNNTHIGSASGDEYPRGSIGSKKKIIQRGYSGTNSRSNRLAQEEELWKDFQDHFKNKDRQKTPMNHHDFLQSLRSQRESGDFSAAPHSRQNRQADIGESLLVHDRLSRAKRNYQKM